MVKRKLSGLAAKIKNTLGNISKLYYYQLML